MSDRSCEETLAEVTLPKLEKIWEDCRKKDKQKEEQQSEGSRRRNQASKCEIQGQDQEFEIRKLIAPRCTK
jgi:hypothetical protein